MKNEEIFGGRGLKNYTTLNGMSSLVNYYLSTNKREILFSTNVSCIELVKSKENETKWNLFSQDGKSIGIFDAVILTIPVPQILNLEGTVNVDFKALKK